MTKTIITMTYWPKGKIKDAKWGQKKRGRAVIRAKLSDRK